MALDVSSLPALRRLIAFCELRGIGRTDPIPDGMMTAAGLRGDEIWDIRERGAALMALMALRAIDGR